MTRAPLDADQVRAAVLRPGGLWRRIDVVQETGSTNADLLAAAETTDQGIVLVAESQNAGRGRLGRTWTSPPRAALTFSVLLRPSLPATKRGWLPLIAGIAAAAAIQKVSGLDPRLKWPNDVLIAGRKTAGILAEATGPFVVIGTGINVSTTQAELPPPGPGGLPPTSLAVAGADDVTREALLIALLAELERLYVAGQEWREEYLRWSGTVGTAVRVELPGDRTLTGTATGIDADGQLLVATSGGVPVTVSAGDVVHLRLQPGAIYVLRHGARSRVRRGGTAGAGPASALESARGAGPAHHRGGSGAAGRRGLGPVQPRGGRDPRGDRRRGRAGDHAVADGAAAAVAHDGVRADHPSPEHAHRDHRPPWPGYPAGPHHRRVVRQVAA
ncbi:MAG: biotin--[acetyl-CoA-carboxylase] ligase [Streptosporangiaceae bacterium]